MPIEDEDVVRIVRLLGEVAAMTGPLPERRRALMLGLAKMIDADVWMWLHSSGLGTDKVIGLAVLDGGWVEDTERGRVVQATYNPEWNDGLVRCLDYDRATTWQFDESCAGWGDGRIFRQLTHETGFDRLMFSTHPLPNGLFSSIGMHRRIGKPPYTPREIAIAHLVLGQVDWLHHLDPPPIVENDGLRHLTPREREVMLHLLSGDGRKQIAAKMGLSEHTVGDYFKTLYRRLNVGSRGELMAKFVSPTGTW